MDGKELPPVKRPEPPKTEASETADGEYSEEISAEVPHADTSETDDTASADIPPEETAESGSDSQNP